MVRGAYGRPPFFQIMPLPVIALYYIHLIDATLSSMSYLASEMEAMR